MQHQGAERGRAPLESKHPSPGAGAAAPCRGRERRKGRARARGGGTPASLSRAGQNSPASTFGVSRAGRSRGE